MQDHAEGLAPAAAEARVRASFARQQAMATIGAEIARVAPGEVDIVMPFADKLTQQHGFIHAGMIASIADSSCGYAALTLMPAGAAVLTSEFKIHLMSPAKGTRFVAQGRVVRAGRTLMVTQGDVFAEAGDSRKHIALITATMVVVQGMGRLSD